MTELKSKVVLKAKEEAFIPVSQLKVDLSWKQDVDFDLMAFYTTKSGEKGGVYTNNIPGGNLGNLNAAPFMELSGDAGVGAVGGDNVETLRVAKLDDIAELYLVALNYTDAAANKASSFSQYDAHVNVTSLDANSQANTFDVPLTATEEGSVALIAKIDNTNPMGPKLISENKVMSTGEFIETVPGADALTK